MDSNKKAHKEFYMPEILGVFVGTGALILWYFSSLAIDKAVVPSTFQSFITFGVSAFGAFFGAYCAFKLRQHEENQSKHLKRQTALTSCLFTMARQHNAVRNMKTLYDQYPEEIPRAINMPAMKPPEYKDLKVNLDELLFLTNHGYIDFLFRLSVEQERFDQAVHAVNLRNETTIEQLQPAIAKHQIHGIELCGQKLRDLLGVQIYYSILNQTNTAYEHLAASQKSIFEMHNKLREIAKSVFPGESFPEIIHPIHNQKAETNQN